MPRIAKFDYSVSILSDSHAWTEVYNIWEMTLKKRIVDVINRGCSKSALLLASSTPLARTTAVFKVIALSPDDSFKALKYVPGAKDIDFLVRSAAKKARWARVILEDLPDWRIETIYKKAVNNEPFWALKYFREHKVKYDWLVDMLDKKRKSGNRKRRFELTAGI